MRTALSLAFILALAASPVLAKTAYCTNPTTHKRISCTVATKPMPAKAAVTARAEKPAKAHLFAKKPAVAATHATKARAMATRSSAATAHKGKKCGNSYIAANRVCHKG